MTFTLSPQAYFASQDKIAKINARAEKRGFTGRFSLNGQRVVRSSVSEFTGMTVTEVRYECEVEGEAPCYNGWVFLARVDTMGESFTLAAAPGVESIDRSLVKPGHCDHCNADRARRNTYLVRNVETGEIKNVGSTCIKDFLGWDGAVVWYDPESIEREVEEFGGSTRFERTYSVDTVIAIAYATTKVFGWTPASMDLGLSTGQRVRTILEPYSKADKDMAAQVRPLAAEAQEKTAEIRDWVLSDEFSGTSVYVDNLKAAVAAGDITMRQVGIVASAPRAHTRHLETAAERIAKQAQWAAERAAKQVSDYIGQEKDKVQFTGTVQAIRYISGTYGTTTLYTFVTDTGNLVKWFASTTLEVETDETFTSYSHRDEQGEPVYAEFKKSREAKEGDVFTLKGTVKKQEEYNGVKSTVVTRCKVVA